MSEKINVKERNRCMLTISCMALMPILFSVEKDSSMKMIMLVARVLRVVFINIF